MRGYYKGLAPSLLLQTTHGAVQFAVYEELKVLLAAVGAGAGGGGASGGAGAGAAGTAGNTAPSNAPPTTLAVTAAAFASKLAAAVSTYPAQVVRARLQQRFDVQPGRPPELVYSSALGAARVMMAREGVAGFYKGLLPSLLRVMPQSAVTLVVYERAAAALEARFGGGGGGREERGGVAPAVAAARGGGGKGGRRQLTDEMAQLELAADAQAEQ